MQAGLSVMEVQKASSSLGLLRLLRACCTPFHAKPCEPQPSPPASPCRCFVGQGFGWGVSREQGRGCQGRPPSQCGHR